MSYRLLQPKALFL